MCLYRAQANIGPRRARGADGPPSWRRGSALADALYLDLQFHFLLEAILVTEVDTEVTAVEGRRGIGAAGFLLGHRVDHALELIDGELHRLRDAVQRELAVDLCWCAVLEFGERSLVGRGRILSHVEHLGRLRVLIELGVTKVNRRRVDRHVHASRAFLFVEHDRARALFELATPDGQATEVISLEAGVSMVGVDVILYRCGDRRAGHEG